MRGGALQLGVVAGGNVVCLPVEELGVRVGHADLLDGGASPLPHHLLPVVVGELRR